MLQAVSAFYHKCPQRVPLSLQIEKRVREEVKERDIIRKERRIFNLAQKDPRGQTSIETIIEDDIKHCKFHDIEKYVDLVDRLYLYPYVLLIVFMGCGGLCLTSPRDHVYFESTSYFYRSVLPFMMCCFTGAFMCQINSWLASYAKKYRKYFILTRIRNKNQSYQMQNKTNKIIK